MSSNSRKSVSVAYPKDQALIFHLSSPPLPLTGVRTYRGTKNKDTRYMDFTSKRRKLPLHDENMGITVSIVIDYNLVYMQMIIQFSYRYNET